MIAIALAVLLLGLPAEQAPAVETPTVESPAVEEPAAAETPAADPVPEKPFPKGTREALVRVTHTEERSGKSEIISSVSAGLGYYVLDDLAVIGEFVGYKLKDDEDGVGFGFNIGARRHFVHFARASIFVEGAGGILGSTEEFPETGTKFNFNYYAGVGTSVELSPGLRLELSARFQHMSNGFIRGRSRNPATNQLGGAVGFSYRF